MKLHLNRLGLLLGVFGAVSVSVAASPTTSAATGAACHQETKRDYVWPKGQKSPQVAKVVEREVTVCDGKAVASTNTTGARDAKRERG